VSEIETTEILQVGDTVEWRGSWGRGYPALTEVTNIILGNQEIAVQAVPWSALKGREVVVDLSNGHWAYGFQIAKPSGDPTVIPDYHAEKTS